MTSLLIGNMPNSLKASEESIILVPAAQVDDESESCIKVTGNHETLRKIDLNGDGEISFEEILAFAKQYESNEKHRKFYRNLALCLLLAVILLTTSNVGTGMLAIKAMKEIKIGGVGTLESVAGSKPLKTEERAHHVSGLPDVNGMGRRRVEDWEAEQYRIGDNRLFMGCVRGIQLLESLVPGTTVNLVSLGENGEGTIKTMIKAHKLYFPPNALESLFVNFDGEVVAQIFDEHKTYTLLAPDDNTNPNSPCAHLNNSTDVEEDIEGEETTAPNEIRKLGLKESHKFRFSDFEFSQETWDKYSALVAP